MINSIKIKRGLSFHLQEPIIKNSLYILSTRIINFASGFVFLMVAAKFYSITNVGIAAALISSLTLVILLSRLGIDVYIIRFINYDNKTRLFNFFLIVTFFLSIIISILYISSISFFSPQLSFIRNVNYAFIFIFFVAIGSIASTTGTTFIATRKAKNYLIQNIFSTARIPLLIPFVFAGSFGILGASGIASIFSALFGLFLLIERKPFIFKIEMPLIRGAFKFSISNYISSIFDNGSVLVLPIIVLNLLGPTNAAKFNIAYAIGNLFIISDALSTSLFVEGSQGGGLRKNIMKTILAIYSILTPTVIFIYFFGSNLLALLGNEYIDAISLLRVFALSSFFIPIYSLFIVIQNIRLDVGSVVIANTARSLLLIGFSYILMLRFGILGIGYAWMIVHIFLAICIIITITKLNWVLRK